MVELWALARPYRLQLAVLAALSVIAALSTLAVPWLAARLLAGIVRDSHSIPPVLPGVLVLLVCVIAALEAAVALVSASTGSRLLADLRIKVYAHVQSLPLAFHENHRQGDTLTFMTYEVARLSQFLTGTLAQLPSRLLMVVGAVVLMFRIDSRLALLVPLLIPVYFVVLKIVGRRLRALARAIQQAEAEVVAVAEENLEMLPAIKAFAREQLQEDRYRRCTAAALGLALRENRIYAVLQPLFGLVAGLGAIALLLAAGQSVGKGQLGAAGLFGLIFYSAMLTRPIGAIANIYGQIQTARGTLERLTRVLRTAPEPGYGEPHGLLAAKHDVLFDRVDFAYPERESILRQATFRVEAGEIVALTGHNGAGKSTIVHLLLRFYEVMAGTISIGGIDIATVDVRDLRRQVGFVPQRPLLFNGSIYENIVFGADKHAPRDVERAAALAQAHDFIVALPDGYDTEIGDHGVRLSGGQRQRIALARALLTNPPLLIFDEATSMFDQEAESAFVGSCAEALRGRTVFLVTHRPASLALADRILLVDDLGVRDLPKAPLRESALQ